MGWEKTTLPDLADRVSRLSGGLRSVGVRPGEALPIVADTPLAALVAFLGAQGAGAWPALLAPSAQFRDLNLFAKTTFAHARASGAAWLLGSAAQIAHISPPHDIEILALEPLLTEAPGPLAEDWPGHFQFTSGSQGQPKAVRIPPSALVAQVASLQERLAWTPEHSTSFWLPWYHDMGLVGGMLAPLTIGCDMWLMAPPDFVRNPLRFLETLGSNGATLTAMPPFGLRLLLRALNRRKGAGPDLSDVRGIIVGAEPIPAKLLLQSEAALAMLGLGAGRLLSAYGLAEAVLAATLSAPGEPLCIARDGHGESRLACGMPVSGFELRIADGSGADAPEGVVGEILLRGRSLAAEPEADGWYHTGDAGFRRGKLLFPVGRFGDAAKIRGGFLFAEDAERKLSASLLSHDRFVVVLGYVDVALHALLVTWGPPPRNISAAMADLRNLTEGGVVWHVSLSAGSVPRTSSGKVKRSVIWTDYRRTLLD